MGLFKVLANRVGFSGMTFLGLDNATMVAITSANALGQIWLGEITVA